VTPDRKVVLVVEDERLVAKDLQLTLARFGYEVPLTVATGDDAIRAASVRCPDLVLMDIHLKGQLDGIEAADILRKEFDVPVVFVTAYSDPETLARAKVTGPHGYLVKPVAPEALRSAIEVALYKHESDRLLREREQWYATTLRSIGDAVISTDPRGRVTFMNPVAEELLGAKSDALVGRPLAEHLRLVDERTAQSVDNPIEQALASKQAVRLDAAVLQRQDGDRTVADSAAPILDDGGGLLGAVLVLQDISEKRRLQRELELADRLASLGMLAAGVAHEINNPLTFVLANLDEIVEGLSALGGRLPELEELGQLAKEARTGVGRIQDVVADLRSLSRPEPEKRRGEVRRALGWALDVAGPELQRRARLHIHLGELPAVAMDETRLGQVLINLLVNATQAIPEGSPSEHTIHVTAQATEREVLVEVHDTGCGMTPEVLRRIFEPFFTTKGAGQGSGLGLSISRGVLEAVGGRIEAESRLGSGSTFRVYLPKHEPATEGTAVVAEPPPREAPFRAQILLIDDEPLVRRAIRRILSSGHEVTGVGSARQALALLRSGQRFDLLLCDMMMPEQTGADLYEILLEAAPGQAARMVFVTGAIFTARTLEFSRTSRQPRLDKPFSPSALLDLVGRLLGEWGPATGAQRT
jgi:two-component system cell cycle sensor histidine kinase/response regulator CckA